MMSTALYLDAPPVIGSGETTARVEHSRMRRRVMYGFHRGDVLTRMLSQIGSVRQEAWGEPDLTGNPALQVYSQVAVMYDRDPLRVAPEGLLSMLRADGLDAKMRRVQRDTLALREMAVLVDPTPVGVTFRPIFPDLCNATEFAERPGTLSRLEEYRKHGGKWVRDVWDVSDPSNPYRRVFTTDSAATDITEMVLGERYEGAGYVWRKGGADGEPVIPAVLYHAERAPTLFDPYSYREVFEGTLNICVLLSFYGHIVRNAAWQQKVFIDLEVAGLDVDGTGNGSHNGIVTDPSTGLMLRSRPDATNPQALTMASPADPELVLRSISMYERRILQIAGFAQADVAKQNADIRSGYSLAVSRESIREQQAKSESTFRPADVALMAIAGLVANRFHGEAFPEEPDDYRIVYRGIPEEPGEEEARIKAIRARQDAGMIGPITAYREAYPGVPHLEAVIRLAEAASEVGELDAAVRIQFKAVDMTPPQALIPVDRLKMAADVLKMAKAGEITYDAAAFLLSQAGFPPAAVTDALDPTDADREIERAGAREVIETADGLDDDTRAQLLEAVGGR